MSEPAATPSILVVDDTVENLHLLADILGKHGYEVRPVTSGRQALQAATSYPPELVLLDVSMPDMDGFEVCRRMKAIDTLREVPVIFLTALTESGDKIKAFEAGGADYITKPFQLDEVLARVRVHVALRRSHAELVRSYEQLRSLEQMREDLVQMVVHDMRSPLTSLIMLLGYVQRDAPATLDPQLRQDLTMALESATGLDRLANDLLDVSRLEDGKLVLVRKSHDLLAICRDAVERLSAIDRARTIDVAGAAPVLASCDRAIIARVVENLVGNAIKHTPEGGRVRISTQPRGANVRVLVQDEGRGVPLQARAKIFEKFGTVEVRREASFHSTGLGLAFCKLAVEAHGGTIGVEPAQPKGSIFWFEIPA